VLVIVVKESLFCYETIERLNLMEKGEWWLIVFLYC